MGASGAAGTTAKRRLWKHKKGILPLDEFNLQAFNEGDFDDDGKPLKLEFPLRDSSLGVPDFRSWAWFQERWDPDKKIVNMRHTMLWSQALLKRINAHEEYKQLPDPGPQPTKAIMTRIQRQRAKRSKAALARWRLQKSKEPGWEDLKPPTTISSAGTTLGGAKRMSSAATRSSVVAAGKKGNNKRGDKAVPVARGSKTAGESNKRSVSPPAQRKASQSPPRTRA